LVATHLPVEGSEEWARAVAAAHHDWIMQAAAQAPPLGPEKADFFVYDDFLLRIKEVFANLASSGTPRSETSAAREVAEALGARLQESGPTPEQVNTAKKALVDQVLAMDLPRDQDTTRPSSSPLHPPGSKGYHDSNPTRRLLIQQINEQANALLRHLQSH